MRLNVALVGCGLIGDKRANAIQNLVNLKTCYDIDARVRDAFAAQHNCTVANSYIEMVENKDIDLVIISTRHDSLAELAQLAIRNRKHVFIEKPGALNSEQFELITNEVNKVRDIKVRIGYNHQYHPAIIQAVEIVKSGEIGQIMFLRARYGHGGRLGYEKEWRANKLISGGGELIDQGSHLLDLSLLFLGDVDLEYAATPTYFWKMEVEDNAFVVVKNKSGAIGFLHASCTEWKNMFSLEIYCVTGKIDISGLGGSYGIEKLTLHKMLNSMGPPDSESWEYSEPDNSWELEFSNFVKDIQDGTSYSDNCASSKRVLEIIEEIYERTSK
jgi:predicted dehydrogenase